MAKAFTSLLTALSLCLVLRIHAVPLKPNVPEEGQQGNNEVEEPGTVETIDQTILKSYGGIEEEKKAEESRKDKGVETMGMDTLLTPEQAELLRNKHNKRRMSKRRQVAFITLWTYGVVPYDFDELASERHGLMQEAFEEWQNYTCVRFVPAQSTHQHKIVFKNGQGCSSYLGMTPWSEQNVSLSDGCHHRGTYLHELGHALGLVHEHQLPQRDRYIYVEANNVLPESLDQFDRYYAEDIPDAEQVTYNVRSIMHYGKYAFSKHDGAQTIHAVDWSQEHLIGSATGLTFTDVKVINLLYNCQERCHSPPTCLYPCFVNENCQCFCKEDIPCENSDPDCEQWASYGFCTGQHIDYMAANCRNACGFC